MGFIPECFRLFLQAVCRSEWPEKYHLVQKNISPAMHAQYAYVTGILKNMLGIREDVLLIQLPNQELLEFEVSVAMQTDEWDTVINQALQKILPSEDQTEEPFYNEEDPEETEAGDDSEVEKVCIEIEPEEGGTKVHISVNALDWMKSKLSAEEYIEKMMNEEPQISTSFNVGNKNPISMGKKKKKKKIIDPLHPDEEKK